MTFLQQGELDGRCPQYLLCRDSEGACRRYRCAGHPRRYRCAGYPRPYGCCVRRLAGLLPLVKIPLDSASLPISSWDVLTTFSANVPHNGCLRCMAAEQYANLIQPHVCTLRSIRPLTQGLSLRSLGIGYQFFLDLPFFSFLGHHTITPFLYDTDYHYGIACCKHGLFAGKLHCRILIYAVGLHPGPTSGSAHD